MEEEEEGREYVLYLPGPLTVKVEEVCGGGYVFCLHGSLIVKYGWGVGRKSNIGWRNKRREEVCFMYTWTPDCEGRQDLPYPS